MENKEELKSILDALNLQLEQSRELLEKAYTAIGEKRPENPVPVFDELPEYEVLDLGLPSGTKWVYLKEDVVLSEMEKYAKFFPSQKQIDEFCKLQFTTNYWIDSQYYGHSIHSVNGHKCDIEMGCSIFYGEYYPKDLTAAVYVFEEMCCRRTTKYMGDSIYPLLVLPNA